MKAFFIKKAGTNEYIKPIKHAFNNEYEFLEGKPGAALFLEHQIMDALKHVSAHYPEFTIVKEQLK